LADDEHTYIIKGPDPRLVFAEYAAYELAALAGIPVPEHALCMIPGRGDVYFASRKLPYRFAPEDLWEHDHVENREMLAETAVFDIWIANDDRNVGNLVAGKGDGDGRIRWYAIDFERAKALRGQEDLFTIMGVHPKQMWPKEQLGRFCSGLQVPRPVCDRIADLGRAVEPIVDAWNSDLALPRVDWCERTATVLSQRASRIHHLVQEAWS
jgi:hypothetical protein